MNELIADLDCPGCKKQFQRPIRDLRPGAHITCPHCQESIELEGDDGAAVQEAVDELTKAFNDLNKKIGGG